MITSLADAWAKWRQRWADFRIDAFRRSELAHEIACLELAGELEGALNNIGLGRGAVPFLLQRYPGAMRRHAALCKRLRIGSPGPSNSYGLDALDGPRLRCLLCPSARRCEKWLRGSDQGLPAFCLSRSTFERQAGIAHAG